MGNLKGILRVEEMKIYFAGDTGIEERERMVLNLADHRLLSYYHPNREKLFLILKEINENKNK